MAEQHPPEDDDHLKSYPQGRRLPDAARTQVRAGFEEQNYAESLRTLKLFLMPLTSGEKHPRIFIPPPDHLALIATLTVHPSLTNKRTDPAWWGVDTHALDYLRNLLSNAGPLTPRFAEAFRFRRVVYRTGGGLDSDAGGCMFEDDDDNIDNLRSNPLASVSSLWGRAADFWSAVGWALVCSSSYPARWPYWREWLMFMVNLIESDWKARHGQSSALHDKQQPSGQSTSTPASAAGVGASTAAHRRRSRALNPACSGLQKSLLSHYMSDGQVVLSGGARHALEAVLAGIFSTSLDRFPPVFDHEDKEDDAHAIGQKRKREEEQFEDITVDNYGSLVNPNHEDYGLDLPSPTQTLQQTRSGRRVGRSGASDAARVAAQAAHPLPVTQDLLESIGLRCRLLGLILAFLDELPRVDLTLNGPEFCNRLASQVKSFPLELLQEFFLASSQDYFVPYYTRDSLATGVLDTMVLGNSLKRHAVDPASADVGLVSQPILEQYLPLAAAEKGPDANARMSVILEQLFQELWLHKVLKYTANLRSLIERGIELRKSKGQASKKQIDTVSKRWLDESSARLMILLDALEDEGNNPEYMEVD